MAGIFAIKHKVEKLNVSDVQNHKNRRNSKWFIEGNISSDSYKNEKWIANDWLGFLKDENLMIYGRWKENIGKWKFLIKFEDTSEINLQIGKEVTVFDGYWGERVEIVIDRNIKWEKSIYTKKDNHDHCAVCWKTISEFENQNYILGDNRIAVCLGCFQQFIEQRNLNFIVTKEKG